MALFAASGCIKTYPYVMGASALFWGADYLTRGTFFGSWFFSGVEKTARAFSIILNVLGTNALILSPAPERRILANKMAKILEWTVPFLAFSLKLDPNMISVASFGSWVVTFPVVSFLSIGRNR